MAGLRPATGGCPRMKTCLLLSAIVVSMILASTPFSHAVCSGGPANFTCDATPPNPDTAGIQEGASLIDISVTMLPGGEINTQGEPGNLDGIETGGGIDTVNMTSAEVRAENVGLDTGGNMDTIKLIDSIVTAIERAIESGNGNDSVMIEGSEVESEKEIAIQTGNDEDIVMISGSRVTSLINDGIETANHNDNVTINDSIITGSAGFFAVDLGNGDDTLTLETGAVLNGGIDCRNDFDTLIFAMEVPTERLNFLSGELALADPQDGSITINGIFYEWEDCELIVNELVGVRMTRPIPTLSEWGLIAMVGLLGLASILVLGRRKFAAN